jgi:hypothetical protein
MLAIGDGGKKSWDLFVQANEWGKGDSFGYISSL